jgi:Skp family chaperone for outer membrane proteins
MQDILRNPKAIVLGAIVLGVVGALRAGAAPPEPALKFAVVDLQAVSQGYNGFTKAQGEFKRKVEDYQTKLQTWRGTPYLPETDQNELSDLMIKQNASQNGGAALTAADSTRLKSLTDKNNAAGQEAQTLQGTQNPTDAQKARISELTKNYQATAARVEKAAKDYQTELQAAEQANTTRLMKEVREGVSKVAKKDGFAVVFTAEVALYGENDITEAVVKQLNSGK